MNILQSDLETLEYFYTKETKQVDEIKILNTHSTKQVTFDQTDMTMDGCTNKWRTSVKHSRKLNLN